MNLKQDVGYKAAEQVKDGQILGLGTGSELVLLLIILLKKWV